jgi:tRNA A-37 threonylcarbamoyl transferase component Bud32
VSAPSLSLSPGDRLGRYQIVALLGAGGMGEVYRALDPQLHRDVALKILRRSSADAEHVERFGREARAASSLNHPNIVAVYDVGTEGGRPYVVTELLEGETLRATLDRGPLPYRKAVEYAIQIAQALDAAHGKGIWHRDVKPANAFVTHDGRVKLLDFGIAKLNEYDRSRVGRSEDVTITVEDSQSAVHGTPGYMSPEQVLGQVVDHRSDIFALGAVLYEMLTGVRAFKRGSSFDTMNAVVHADPADPSSLNANLSPMAAAVVRRCLEKNREERYQSARDLAFQLQQLRDGTASTRPNAGPRPVVRRWKWPALLIGAGALAGTALGAWLLGRPDALPPPTFEQLTFSRGRIGGARFASTGNAVVYSMASQGHALEVSRLDIGDTPSSRPLNYPLGSDVLSARGGEVAVSLGRKFVLGERFVGTLAVAALGGGAPRSLAENIEDADYDATGKQLAVVRSSGDVVGQSAIEFPLGKTLYTTSGSLRFLRMSRDGQRLAFVEDAAGRGVSGRVSVVDLAGKVTVLTKEWDSVRGLAWSASGDEIWFTAGARPHRVLRAVDLASNDRLVHETPGSLTLWDIAPDGRVLLARDEERRTVVVRAPGEDRERDLSWLDDSGVADISDDGKVVLGRDRSGVFLRPTDGSVPTQLGIAGFADDLSPDGTTVLASVESSRKLVLVPTGPGDTRALPRPETLDVYRGARWFPDGKRVLFNANEKGKGIRAYVQDTSGGLPKPLTPEGTLALAIARQSDRVAGVGANQMVSIWSVPDGVEVPVKGAIRGDRPVSWTSDGRALWLFRRGEVPGPVFKLDLATGQRELSKMLVPADAAGVYSIIEFQITPDGTAYAYGYTRLLSELYLVRGLK